MLETHKPFCRALVYFPKLVQFIHSLVHRLTGQGHNVNFGSIGNQTLPKLLSKNNYSKSEIAAELTLQIMYPSPLVPPVTTATYSFTEKRLSTCRQNIVNGLSILKYLLLLPDKSRFRGCVTRSVSACPTLVPSGHPTVAYASCSSAASGHQEGVYNEDQTVLVPFVKARNRAYFCRDLDAATSCLVTASHVS